MNQTAINYGQVLLELAVPREDIESSRQIWESSLPLRQALTNPVIQNKQKNKASPRTHTIVYAGYANNKTYWGKKSK